MIFSLKFPDFLIPGSAYVFLICYRFRFRLVFYTEAGGQFVVKYFRSPTFYSVMSLECSGNLRLKAGSKVGFRDLEMLVLKQEGSLRLLRKQVIK